jgi:hypothetical protein
MEMGVHAGGGQQHYDQCRQQPRHSSHVDAFLTSGALLKSSGLRAGLLQTAPERKSASAHLGFRQPMHVHPQPWRSVTLTRRPEDLSLAMEELD